MDVRRVSTAQAHPHPHFPPQQHQPHPQSAVDPRSAAPYSPHYQQQQHHPVQYPQQGPPPPNVHQPSPSQQAAYNHPQSSTPSREQQQQLPPIQGPYGPPSATSDTKPPLPSFRHPSQPQPHDNREGQEYAQYNHGRSEQTTPINRSFSHDSMHRTPTTPPQPGQHQPGGPPHHMEHGHHGPPMPNGAPHGMPGPPPHHDPHAQYMQPGMDPHHQYQQPMYAPPYSAAAVQNGAYNVARKKQMRATQACEQCRQRKQKCDEGNPCSFCKENTLSCTYRDTPPAKTDKNMEKLLGHIEEMQQQLSDQATMMKTMEGIIQRLDSNEARRPVPQSRPASSNGQNAEEPPLPKANLDDHRTAPHKLLLLWPSVRRLLTKADPNHRLKDTYVMEAETRAILRLHTRGEGLDVHDGTQVPNAPSPGDRSDDSPAEMPNSSVYQSSPTEGLWGTGFVQAAMNDVRRTEASWGGLKSDNSLDLDVNTINALFESYMKHMHIMHPFLDRHGLRRVFDTFIKRYATGQPKRSASFAVGPSNDDNERASKRQRPNGSTGYNSVHNEGYGSGVQATERSPANGLVFLVMALGKVCLHKEPLPGPVADNRLSVNSTVTHQVSGIPGHSPVSASNRMSPTSPMSTHPTPPAFDGSFSQQRSRRSSVDPVQPAGARNIDVMPGLAYFAKAAEVIGENADGNDLIHAQMFILAGLYKGQLARVKESMGFFQMAGRAIITLMDTHNLLLPQDWGQGGNLKKRFDRAQALVKDKRSNHIVLASWTCLQLESDILAELRLPSSGLQGYESRLLLPLHVPSEESYDGLDPIGSETEDNIMLFYVAQTFLRKRLNKVHRELYGPDCMEQTLVDVRDTLSMHEATLANWRENLPPKLRWRDDDPPPSDILSARLRAKYWGARYVINRPFLDFALHILPHTKEGRSVADVAIDGQGNTRHPAEIHLFEAIHGMGEAEIWHASKRCVDAAMQSTVALDGMANRLVVTNIHGTAHAQFGNMLVLSTAYHEAHLRRLVKKERLGPLLARTIRFLRRLGPISPTCTIDCGILEKIQKTLFGVPSDARTVYDDEKHFYDNEAVNNAPSTNTSFSGATT